MNAKRYALAAALTLALAAGAAAKDEYPTADDLRMREFLAVCARGDESGAKRLMATSADIALAVDPLRRTGLHAAAETGQTAVAKTLLAAGADVNARTEAGQTPLHLAVQNGHAAAAELLLSAGADVNAKDRLARPALLYAVEDGRADLTGLLMAHGADELLTPLHKAVLTHTLFTVPFNEVMAAANEPGRYDCPPLHWAASLGHRDEAKRLLLAGADPNAKDNLGRTPLFRALKNRHYDVAELLLDKGADPSAFDYPGSTPLHLAAKTGDAAAAALLIKRGANVNASHDAKSRTPMTWETPNPVVDEDGDYAPDSPSWTPLFWAVKNNHADIADMLLKAGADVNARDRHQRTPLFIAEREGSEAMAGRLLAAGADPRAADWQGDTAVPQPKPSAAPKKPLRERLAEILNEK